MILLYMDVDNILATGLERVLMEMYVKLYFSVSQFCISARFDIDLYVPVFLK